MKDIPEEWVQMAMRAYWDAPGHTKSGVAAAIAAVAPLIAAAEREKCAKVAERRWRDWPGIHPDDAKKAEVCDDVTACADIAAAIRARSDAP